MRSLLPTSSCQISLREGLCCSSCWTTGGVIVAARRKRGIPSQSFPLSWRVAGQTAHVQGDVLHIGRDILWWFWSRRGSGIPLETAPQSFLSTGTLSSLYEAAKEAFYSEVSGVWHATEPLSCPEKLRQSRKAVGLNRSRRNGLSACHFRPIAACCYGRTLLNSPMTTLQLDRENKRETMALCTIPWGPTERYGPLHSSHIVYWC